MEIGSIGKPKTPKIGPISKKNRAKNPANDAPDYPYLGGNRVNGEAQDAENYPYLEKNMGKNPAKAAPDYPYLGANRGNGDAGDAENYPYFEVKTGVSAVCANGELVLVQEITEQPAADTPENPGAPEMGCSGRAIARMTSKAYAPLPSLS